MADNGVAMISSAVAEAVANRIRGASVDKVMMAAGVNPLFAKEAERVTKTLELIEDRWDIKAKRLNDRGLMNGDEEYDRALARHEKQVMVLEDYMTSMYEVATKMANEAISN